MRPALHVASLAALLSAMFAVGCEITPSYVTNTDIDDALARSHYKTMCVGLSMKDDDVRTYATERFEAITKNEPPDPAGVAAGKDCICSHLKDAHGHLDMAIANGLKGSSWEDVVGCMAKLVEDPSLDKRDEAVIALSHTAARSGRDALARIAQAPGDATVRLRATEAISGNADYEDELIKLATTDEDPAIRAAATAGIARFKDDKAMAAMMKLAKEDTDGTVRGSALQALHSAGVPDADAMLCDAMMNDESPEVRSRAILAFRGTKRDEAIDCLRKRALAKEDDAGVRDAMLTVLKSSPNQKAADVLCDAIPFWMRSYVIDDLPDQLPGTDIAKAQNDRDWKGSYKCMEKAYRSSGGYSCYARMYTAWWFREVGGTSYIPKCPKYPD